MCLGLRLDITSIILLPWFYSCVFFTKPPNGFNDEAASIHFGIAKACRLYTDTNCVAEKGVVLWQVDQDVLYRNVSSVRCHD